MNNSVNSPSNFDFSYFQHGNAERCLSILSAESDRFLYGGGIEVLDSPMPVQPSSQNTPIDEPISISIPQTNTSPYLPNRTAPPPLQPLIRPMTLAQPSPGMGYVSTGPVERPPPSASTSYDQSMWYTVLSVANFTITVITFSIRSSILTFRQTYCKCMRV